MILMVDEEIPPECLEKTDKRYINVINYYYLFDCAIKALLFV